MPEDGPVDEYLEELRLRWEEDPSSRVFLQLAEEYRRVGRTRDALEVLDAGLERHPHHISAQVARGRCLLELGELPAALEALQEVVHQDATHLVARKLLVEAHLQRGDAVQARRQLDLYSGLNPADGEIEALRARIQEQLLADPEPALEEPAAPAQPIEPYERELELDELMEEAAVEDEVAQEVEAPVAEPQPAPPAAPRVLLAPGGEDPFPGLGGGGEHRRYLSGLGAEGIFPVAVEAAESAAAAVAGAVLEAELAGGGDEGGSFDAATPTLGELYLRQGHYDEAERIFREVLSRDPGNAVALAGLEALADAPPSVGGEAGGVAAATGEMAQKKVELLRRYLTLVARERGRNVS